MDNLDFDQFKTRNRTATENVILDSDKAIKARHKIHELEEVKAELKLHKRYTLPESDNLAARLLMCCPPSGSGFHSVWVWDCARLLQRRPFNYSPIDVYKLMNCAARDLDRELQPHEIPDAIINSNPNGEKAIEYRRQHRGEGGHKSTQAPVNNLLIQSVSLDKVTLEDMIAASTFDPRECRTQDLLLIKFGPILLPLAWDKMADCHATYLNDEKWLSASRKIPPWLTPQPAKAILGNKGGKAWDRTKKNMKEEKYLITEWDEPYTIEQQVKFIMFLEELGNMLELVVYSGDESLHAWWYGRDKELIKSAKELGACSGTLQNAVELVRTPNAINPKTKKHQTTYYINI